MKKHHNSATKQITRASLGIVGSSISLGVGSQIVGKVGGPTAASGQKAIGVMARYQPTLAGIQGSGIVLKQLKKSNKKTSWW